MQLSKALFTLAALSVVSSATAQVTVLGPSLTAPAADAPIRVQSGRFVPVAPASGKPIYLAEDRGYRVYVVKPGSAFTGVKWDAAADAEPESYSWPDVKGPVYVILARGYAGNYVLQPLINGPVDVGPVKDGGPLKIEIVSGKGPQPPPVDPVVVGKLFGWVMIEESSQAWAGRGDMLAKSIAWSDANAVVHRVADKDVKDATGKPPADMVPYLDRAKGKSLPRLFLLTDKGGMLYEGDCPRTAADMLALLGRYK